MSKYHRRRRNGRHFSKPGHDAAAAELRVSREPELELRPVLASDSWKPNLGRSPT